MRYVKNVFLYHHKPLLFVGMDWRLLNLGLRKTHTKQLHFSSRACFCLFVYEMVSLRDTPFVYTCRGQVPASTLSLFFSST